MGMTETVAGLAPSATTMAPISSFITVTAAAERTTLDFNRRARPERSA